MGADGFVRDEKAILQILVGYFGDVTAFPIHRLRHTLAARRTTARPVHILMISDDGTTTMFDRDERGASGWNVAAAALAKGRLGGTMALNLPGEMALAISATTNGSLLRRSATRTALSAAFAELTVSIDGAARPMIGSAVRRGHMPGPTRVLARCTPNVARVAHPCGCAQTSC